MRALCARIQLRNKQRREPSAIAMEVQAQLERFNEHVAYKEVAAAFRSGEGVRLRDFTSPQWGHR
jgi:hypothetical protein